MEKAHALGHAECEAEARPRPKTETETETEPESNTEATPFQSLYHRLVLYHQSMVPVLYHHGTIGESTDSIAHDVRMETTVRAPFRKKR